MPGGKNAKRNHLSLAALVGGTLLSIQQNKEREARPGGRTWFWDLLQLFYI